MDQRDAVHRAGREKRERGFSLVETLFAVFLLVVAGGGLVRAIAQVSQARRTAATTDLATRIARAKLEELLAAPFSRAWPRSGYHEVVAPGGSVGTGDAGSPGYFEYFGENGEPSDRRSAHYEVRWRIRELAPPAQGQLASLRFEIVALPISAGRGPVVTLESVRVANRE